MKNNNAAFTPIFDGTTLKGWHSVPRLPVPRAPGQPGPDTTTEAYRRATETSGKWTIEDGAIAGRQDPPGCGYGGYPFSARGHSGFVGFFATSSDTAPLNAVRGRAGGPWVPAR